MAISVGERAPRFELPSTEGTAKLDGLGKRLVLYFYPRDNTPGCTREAQDFAERYEAFRELGVEIWGVSKDSLASHERFRAKFGLPFPLLSDADNAVARVFGAYGTKKMYGKEVEGVIRSTFLVGPDGTIEAVWSPVRVAGHADEVLAKVRAIVAG
ncbi:MAG TPA: peroxiredoxin [Fredinandcohnia sp.]|nr:peroxiredoxin [Fredinandcohnia sp.]